MPKEFKGASIRMSIETWKKLRRLQEEGKIKSIHQAFLDAIEKHIKEIT